MARRNTRLSHIPFTHRFIGDITLGTMRAKKAIAISFLAVLGTVTLVFVTMPVWGGWLLQRSLRLTYDSISKVSLPCEAGTTQVTEGWSKAGYSVSCRHRETIDGPWQAWENGHIAISGSFAKGKEHGTWVIYESDGKRIYQTITYENGNEVSRAVH